MMIECAKMNCSECQHNGTCTNQKNVELFRKLFTRYGYYSPETCEKHINLYEPHPENLNTHELIEKAFERTAQDIRLLEYAIEQLKAYQIALSEQYNYIATSPTREKISLIRRRSYSDKKVFYYIKFYSINLNNGHSELMETLTYSGKDRKKALEHFESLQKEHNNAVFEKDIEPAKWER